MTVRLPDPAAAAEQTFRVTEEDAGARLDRWLADRCPDHSRSAVTSLVRDGAVTVDGAEAKASQAVRAGQVVRVLLPPMVEPEVEAEDLPLPILHVDDHIVVVDKPAGMVVHPSRGHWSGTVVNALLHHVDGLSSAPSGNRLRPGIVHRLDRFTSGVMVAARTDAAHRLLAAQFAARTVAKQYLAVAEGRVEADEQEVDLPLGRSLRDREIRAVRHDDGRPSQTLVTVECRATVPAGDFTVVRCRPRTGRTHQIRVHMRALGHPLAGDPAYGGRARLTGADLDPDGVDAVVLDRQALHAASLEFDHPADGRHVRFEAAPPADLDVVLRALREEAS